ncbi:MAG: AbrB/MazE/SpoVT family DNA-binding domain-containing protein [candidate division WOR-3 bacterium]|nr:MAG: AbrB/MazE/SpoVT family DNA-binding domain-containing protein [candidate division WOR-3 bacterium]
MKAQRFDGRSKSPKKRKKCCRVESVVTIDDRGQLVLPKDIRDSANIHAGDKFVVISWEKDGHVLGITLMRVEQLTDSVNTALMPLLDDQDEDSV